MTTEIELRQALQEARDLIAANRLMLGEYQGVREVARIEKRIEAALAGPLTEPLPAPGSPAAMFFMQRQMAMAERDEARAEVERLRGESDHSCIRCDREWSDYCAPCMDSLHAEVERLKAELDEKSGHIADVERLIPYKDYISDKTCAENVEAVLSGAYQRGAEAMREAAAQACLPVLRSMASRSELAATIRALPLPKEKP